MLQLYLRDRQFNCHLRCTLHQRLDDNKSHCQVHIPSFSQITSVQTISIPYSAPFQIGFLSKAGWCSWYSGRRVCAQGDWCHLVSSWVQLLCELNNISWTVEMCPDARALLFTECLCYNSNENTIIYIYMERLLQFWNHLIESIVYMSILVFNEDIRLSFSHDALSLNPGRHVTCIIF